MKNNSMTQSANQDQSQLNTSADVGKISGGTMAEIIEKISEIMASIPQQQQDSAADNFSALFEVVGKSFDKVKDTMQKLAQEPLVVAAIKDDLKETEGGKIFDKLISEHLNNNQKAAVNQVSEEDLKKHREEIRQDRQNQTGLSLA